MTDVMDVSGSFPLYFVAIFLHRNTASNSMLCPCYILFVVLIASFFFCVRSFPQKHYKNGMKRIGVFMTSDDDPQSPMSPQSNSSDTIQDLTDRFKYKVNALMGTYDPMQTMPDNERSSGNILNAMLQFPTEYCFHVLGKTDGDEDMKQMYINEVKQIVGIDKELRVIERGTRYVKLSVNVTVDSTAVINTIYEALGSLERTVMKF